MNDRFQGVFTPLVTPLTADGAPDLPSLQRLVAFQLESGVHGLWVMGTSAEFAGFDDDERAAAAHAAIEAAGRRVPVIVNVSDASTRRAIRHGLRARDAGADAIAATPPYYYPHSQDELLDHYRAIRSAVDLPLFIYNIPQTVRVKVELGTARTLAGEGCVRGIKDSQNDLEWFRQLAGFARERSLTFAPFLGTRYLIDAGVLAGACGAIPSIANAFPDLCVAVYEAAAQGNYQRSGTLQAQIIALESIAARHTAGGSANAAVLGFNKALLTARGVIDRPDLSGPLRTPAEEERAAMVAAVDALMATPV